LKALLALLILGATLLVGACNSTSSSGEPSLAPLPSVDTGTETSPETSPEASPS